MLWVRRVRQDKMVKTAEMDEMVLKVNLEKTVFVDLLDPLEILELAVLVELLAVVMVILSLVVLYEDPSDQRDPKDLKERGDPEDHLALDKKDPVVDLVNQAPQDPQVYQDKDFQAHPVSEDLKDLLERLDRLDLCQAQLVLKDPQDLQDPQDLVLQKLDLVKLLVLEEIRELLYTTPCKTSLPQQMLSQSA